MAGRLRLVPATTHVSYAARRLNGSNGRCLTGKEENRERQGGDAGADAAIHLGTVRFGEGDIKAPLAPPPEKGTAREEKARG